MYVVTVLRPWLLLHGPGSGDCTSQRPHSKCTQRPAAGHTSASITSSATQGLSEPQSPTKQVRLHRCPATRPSTEQRRALTTNWPGGQFLPVTPTATSAQTAQATEGPAQVTGEASPWPTARLPYKASLPTRDIAALPTPQNQTQEGSELHRQRNMPPMKEMEASKLLAIEFKTRVIKLLKDSHETFKKLNENVKDMKKNQLEIKHTLTEIENGLQRFNRREDSKNQTNN